MVFFVFLQSSVLPPSCHGFPWTNVLMGSITWSGSMWAGNLQGTLFFFLFLDPKSQFGHKPPAAHWVSVKGIVPTVVILCLVATGLAEMCDQMCLIFKDAEARMCSAYIPARQLGSSKKRSNPWHLLLSHIYIFILKFPQDTPTWSPRGHYVRRCGRIKTEVLSGGLKNKE